MNSWSEHWSPIELLNLGALAKSILDNLKEATRNTGERKE